MPKAWKTRYDDGRKYNAAWERQFPWVTKSPDGGDCAYCRLCRKTLQPRLSTLSTHSKVPDHIARAGAALSSRSLSASLRRADQDISDDVKKVELELATAVCCHCATMAIDHFGEIISRNATGSKLSNMRLHRTKCSKLITRVISPALEQEFIADVRGVKFALLIDESTDLSSDKHMCVCIRYFSINKNSIVTEYVGLVPIVEATGEALFNALKNRIEQLGLSLSDCVGFGCDGASVMVGCNNSVWSRLRDIAPDCVLMKCVCHSLALCVQHAFNTLPSHLGFLLSEVPSWFSKSTIRREAFKSLFSVMDPNNERQGTPSPFLKMSTTRWLVRGKVINNLLLNWEELKAYFSCAQTGGADARYKAGLISNMLADDVNYLYFHFLAPVVAEFDRINATFQATQADPHFLLTELSTHYHSLYNRVYDKAGNRLPVHGVDFGLKFLSEIQRLMQQCGGISEFTNKVDEMKMRCSNFLVALVTEVEKRMPADTNTFKRLSAFHPDKILSQTARLPFSELPYRHLMSDINKLEQQYRNVIFVAWDDHENVFAGTIPMDAATFWAGVLKYTNSTNERPFYELALYCLNCLCLPVSNAVVERVFSVVTAVKTKSRNRMSFNMLDSILRIRLKMAMNNNCCKDFVVTKEMIDRFNVTMYETADHTDTETTDLIDIGPLVDG